MCETNVPDHSRPVNRPTATRIPHLRHTGESRYPSPAALDKALSWSPEIPPLFHPRVHRRHPGSSLLRRSSKLGGGFWSDPNPPPPSFPRRACPREVGGGNPSPVAATDHVGTENPAPIFIPLCGLRKAMVIPRRACPREVQHSQIVVQTSVGGKKGLFFLPLLASAADVRCVSE